MYIHTIDYIQIDVYIYICIYVPSWKNDLSIFFWGFQEVDLPGWALRRGQRLGCHGGRAVCCQRLFPQTPTHGSSGSPCGRRLVLELRKSWNLGALTDIQNGVKPIMVTINTIWYIFFQKKHGTHVGLSNWAFQRGLIEPAIVWMSTGVSSGTPSKRRTRWMHPVPRRCILGCFGIWIIYGDLKLNEPHSKWLSRLGR